MEARLIRFIDSSFDRLRRGYARWLHGSLNYLPVTAVFSVLILGSIYFLYSTTRASWRPRRIRASSSPSRPRRRTPRSISV